jgi:hypothetical protein
MMATKLPSLASRAKRDPALLRRALKDPGLRSKLPDNLLPVALRKVRQQNQYRSDLGDITSPLAGSSLLNVARGITDSQYNPAANQITQQEQQVTAQRNQAQARNAAIYKQLADYQAAAQSAQNAAAQQGAQAVQGAGQAAQTTIATIAQQNADQATKDAAVRGAGLDGGANAQAAQRTADMTGQAALAQQSAATTQQQNSSADDAVLRGIGQATQQQGAEVSSGLGKAAQVNLDKLAADRADLGDKKRASYLDTLLKLRQSGIDQNITQIGLGQKDTAAQQSAAEKAASLAQEDRNSRRSANTQRARIKQQAADKAAQVNSYGYTNKDWQAMSTAKRRQIIADSKSSKSKGAGKDKGPGRLPQSQQNTVWSRIGQTYSQLKSDNPNATNSQILASLVNGQAADPKTKRPAIKGMDPDEARIALSLFLNGGKLGPDAVNRAHHLGLKIGHRYQTGAKPRPRSSGSASGKQLGSKIIDALSGLGG